jgi:hypothetical protein
MGLEVRLIACRAEDKLKPNKIEIDLFSVLVVIIVLMMVVTIWAGAMAILLAMTPV